MFEVEIDDLGQRVHLCRFVVADKFLQALLELSIYSR